MEPNGGACPRALCATLLPRGVLTFDCLLCAGVLTGQPIVLRIRRAMQYTGADAGGGLQPLQLIASAKSSNERTLTGKADVQFCTAQPRIDASNATTSSTANGYSVLRCRSAHSAAPPTA